MWRHALMAFAASAAIETAAAAQPLSLPIAFNDQGLPYAEFHLNGDGPHRLIVDTGAAISVIRATQAEPLGAPRTPGDVNIIGLLDETLASRVRVTEFRSGASSASVDMALLQNESGIADADAIGVAGMDVFTSLSDDARYIEFDFARRRIRSAASYRRLAERTASRWTALVPLPGEAPLIAIPVDIQGVEGVALLDSGLNFAVLNTAYADALKARKRGRFVSVSDINAQQAEFEIVEAKRLSGAGFSWRNPKAMVFDPEAFDALDLSDRPTILLGANFLADLRVVLDRQEARVLIDTPDADGSDWPNEFGLRGQ